MANEKPLDLSTLQAGLKRYDDSLPEASGFGANCATEAGNQVKVVDTFQKLVKGKSIIVRTGTVISVYFSYGNSVSYGIYLNVDGSGPKQVVTNQGPVGTSNPLLWTSGAKLQFMCIGEQWHYIGQPGSYVCTAGSAADEAYKVASVVVPLVICFGTRLTVVSSTANTYDDGTLYLRFNDIDTAQIYRNNTPTTPDNTALWNSGEAIDLIRIADHWEFVGEPGLSDAAVTGDYNDLINKPEHNPDDINNNIFRKGIKQWSLEIKTGSSDVDSSTNTTTWTIPLTQDMIDVINESADGDYSYIGGPRKYCSVRCQRDEFRWGVESLIRITREGTSIPDLQVGDEIVFTITGQWIDYDDFWTGVEDLYIGDAMNAKIVRSGADVSDWTVEGYYFSWDKISAKKVTADTVGDKDGTLADLRETVNQAFYAGRIDCNYPPALVCQAHLGSTNVPSQNAGLLLSFNSVDQGDSVAWNSQIFLTFEDHIFQRSARDNGWGSWRAV